MVAMVDIKVQRSDVLGSLFDPEHGAKIQYSGFCRECKALVSLTEEVPSRALYAFLERTSRKPSPEKGDRDTEGRT